jgi:hypothetical protein
MTPAEMLLNNCAVNDAFMEAYLNHYFPLCPGCGERIPSSKQLPPAKRIKYDNEPILPGKHLSVCPLSLAEG